MHTLLFRRVCRCLIAPSAVLLAFTALSACGGGGSSTPPLVQNPAGSGSSVTPSATSTPAPSTSTEVIDSVVISASDTAEAKSATNLHRHNLAAHTGAGKTQNNVPPTIQYPEDLGYGGGPVLTHVTEHNVYVSVTNAAPVPSTWGDPYRFLYDLGRSSFIHVTDQYTQTSGSYFPGESLKLADPNLGFAPLYDNDIFAVLHAAAAKIKKPGETGYERIYNLFFPPGVDICETFTTQCYSPDNLGTFAFCAYHASVDFPDVGHVLYTVQPYQGGVLAIGGQLVPVCSVQDPASSNFVSSATDSSLSHETFETITDPDPPTGWTVPYSNGGVAGGFEIGDLCSYTPSEQSELNGTVYDIQPEYSNLVHGCVNDNIASK